MRNTAWWRHCANERTLYLRNIYDDGKAKTMTIKVTIAKNDDDSYASVRTYRGSKQSMWTVLTEIDYIGMRIPILGIPVLRGEAKIKICGQLLQMRRVLKQRTLDSTKRKYGLRSRRENQPTQWWAYNYSFLLPFFHLTMQTDFSVFFWKTKSND